VPPTTALVGFVPGTRTVVTHTARTGINDKDQEAPTGPVEFHDADTDRTWSVLSSDDVVTMIELSPDSRSALIRSACNRTGRGIVRLCLFEAATGRLATDLPLCSESGEPATFSPDGRWLVYEDPRPEASIRIWDVANGCERPAPDHVLKSWGFAPDGRWLALEIPGERQPLTQIIRWNLATRETGAAMSIPEGAYSCELHFAPNGQTLVAGCRYRDRQSVYFRCGWDSATGRERFRVEGDHLALFPTETPWFAVMDNWGPVPVRLFDYDTGRECGQIPVRQEHKAELLRITPDGRQLVAKAYIYNPWLLRLNAWWPRRPEESFITTRLKIVSVTDGRTAAVLPSQFDWDRRDGLERTQFSPDGSLLALMTDTEIEVWDMPPRKSLTWFVVTAIGLTLPVAGLARRRSRRLRQVMTA
jgi:WD40 repeat protein